MPAGSMTPIGYVVMQHAVRLDRPVQAYARWMDKIPGEYRRSVLDEAAVATVDTPADAATADPAITTANPAITTDEHCLGMLRHYRSLMPYAQHARKPIFKLTPADGAIGGHVNAARECYKDFHDLACAVAERCDITCPRLGPEPTSSSAHRGASA